MPEIQASEALYYPGMLFPSVAWVKASLLYWEGLERIVPDGLTPDDPPEIQELARAGLIQNLSPAPFRDATTEIFGKRLEDLLRSRGGKPLEDSPAPGGEKDQLIHRTRMDRSLVRELEAKGLLSAAGEWARMSPAVARLYLISMATVVAQELHIAPVTYDDRDDVALTYFTFKKVARDPSAVPLDGLGWARLYAPFPSPAAAEALSVKKLLAVREKLTRLRRGFRETVQRRTAMIASLPSAEAIRSHLEELAQQMNDDLRVQQEALRAAKVRDRWTLLGVTAPVSLGAGATLAGGPPLFAVAGGFGSVGLGFANWYLAPGAGQGSKGSYLLVLGHDLDQKALEQLGEPMHRLVHGPS
jgi:hypothetical protein